MSSVAKVLTNNSLTNIIDITLNAASMVNGVISWMIVVTDGTDYQTLAGVTTFSAANKGGNYTTAVNNNNGNDAKSLTKGTLTTIWDLFTGTNKVTIRVNANSSLTPSANYPAITYSLMTDSPTAITYL